jgi:hypothetical protein
MKIINLIALYAACAALILSCSGCAAAKSLADGIAGKSISGSGTFGYSTVGFDATTQTPELTSLFVWGDYNSIVSGQEVFRMEKVEDSSIFNSSATTKRTKIFFATGDQTRMDIVLNKFSETKPAAANNAANSVGSQKRDD